MTKLLGATFTLALLLSGCGATPTAANLHALRSTQSVARPAMPAPLNVQISHALQPQFPGARVSVSDVAERLDEPGTYKFAAQVQARNHRTITNVDGEIDMPSHNIRVLNSDTETL
jgi:hypothetical protein